jgi:hypothetical protein
MGGYDVVWIAEGSEEDVLCGRNRRTRQICSPEQISELASAVVVFLSNLSRLKCIVNKPNSSI